jgi:hypothetical protein
MLLLLVGVVVMLPTEALIVLKVPFAGLVPPIIVLLIVPPVKPPPVIVFPVKVKLFGSDRVMAVLPDDVISFAVPLTLVTGVPPEAAAVIRP